MVEPNAVVWVRVAPSFGQARERVLPARVTAKRITLPDGKTFDRETWRRTDRLRYGTSYTYTLQKVRMNDGVELERSGNA